MTVYWVWLSRCRGVGPVTARSLLETFGSPEAVYHASEAALERAGLSASLRAALACKELGGAQTVCERCRAAGVRILSLWEDGYPAALRQNRDAPLLLYCKGVLPDPTLQPWIGIVGARQADALGLANARLLGWQIAGCGGVVVTGMAKGVDAEAAQGALDRGAPGSPGSVDFSSERGDADGKGQAEDENEREDFLHFDYSFSETALMKDGELNDRAGAAEVIAGIGINIIEKRRALVGAGTQDGIELCRFDLASDRDRA